MSLVQVRQEIDEKLDELSPEMLKAVHTILYGPADVVVNDNEEIVGYDANDKEVTLEEFRKEAVEEVNNVLKGEYTSANDVHKKTEQWLGSMK